MTAYFKFDPPVIAHRGASAYAPENTMAAFAKAKALGIQWVELDVILTADHEIVIFHDDDLDRTTNGSGPLHRQTYRYLKTLDAGSWFHPAFAGERIPTLKQFMEFLTAEQLAVNVELKEMPGQEELLVKHVLAVLSPYLSAEKSPILFSSFSLTGLQFLRKYSPTCQMGLLMHEWLPDWHTLCDTLQCVSVHVNHRILTQQRAQQIKSANKLLLCYTVNSPSRAAKLYSWGVDAVFSDCPDKILEVL